MTLNTTALRTPRELVSYKLFNDKITLSKYHQPKVEFDYLDVFRKQHRVTGEISNWNWTDAYRRERSFESSIKRCLSTLTELSEKNKFHWFLTVSFNQLYVDRYSAEAVHKLFKNIMKRLKHRLGGVSYISVPEFHKDRAIHYHVMINFPREPKTHYHPAFRGSEAYWTFAKSEKLRKGDCTLILKRLHTNNLHYLTKYITKGADYPLTRKFSATRDLNRSRLVDKIPFTQGFDTLADFAERQGFSIVFKRGETATLGVTGTPHGERARAAVDLFNIDIKDEKLSDFYYRFIAEYLQVVEEAKKRLNKNRKNRDEAEKQVIDEKLPLGQLAFKLDKNTKISKRGEYYWN